ncbi:MAG: glycosyltransferase family 2 protein, partial [Tepidisphaeraceae bacterium]
MNLGIVILNYKTPELTVGCLRSVAGEIESLAKNCNCGLRAVVVDNFSNDDSVSRIATEIETNGWSAWASVLPLSRNGGFAYGSNRGIENLGETDYFLVLNSDCVLHPGVLQRCVSVMESNLAIGAMSCALQNPDGSLQTVARRFPTPLRSAVSALGLPWLLPSLFAWANIEDPDWHRGTVKRDVDWLGGAFLFIRAAALAKTGPLDEEFFFYGEDVEFCYRLKKAHFSRHYDPAGRATHIGGASGGGDSTQARREANYLVLRKCYGRWAQTLVRGADHVAIALRGIKA